MKSEKETRLKPHLKKIAGSCMEKGERRFKNPKCDVPTAPGWRTLGKRSRV